MSRIPGHAEGIGILDDHIPADGESGRRRQGDTIVSQMGPEITSMACLMTRIEPPERGNVHLF